MEKIVTLMSKYNNKTMGPRVISIFITFKCKLDFVHEITFFNSQNTFHPQNDINSPNAFCPLNDCL